QAEDGIRDFHVTGVQTCALPIGRGRHGRRRTELAAGEHRGRARVVKGNSVVVRAADPARLATRVRRAENCRRRVPNTGYVRLPWPGTVRLAASLPDRSPTTGGRVTDMNSSRTRKATQDTTTAERS